MLIKLSLCILLSTVMPGAISLLKLAPASAPAAPARIQPVPDLYVSQYSLSPSVPIQEQPVAVRIEIYNGGAADAGAFDVEWWAGEKFPTAGCTWRQQQLAARERRVLTYNYAGYASWYARITSKVVVDAREKIAEREKDNNVERMELQIVAAPAPDLYVSEFTLSPSPLVQRRRVEVRIGVYNKEATPAGPFTVEWWAGENFPSPSCSWQVRNLSARGRRILTCSYSGYESWYARLVTKAVVDSGQRVREQDEENNEEKREIQVQRQ